MMPYHEKADGTRGERLPEVASGDEVDIVLETGRCERVFPCDIGVVEKCACVFLFFAAYDTIVFVQG